MLIKSSVPNSPSYARGVETASRPLSTLRPLAAHRLSLVDGTRGEGVRPPPGHPQAHGATDMIRSVVEIYPSDVVSRRVMTWPGMTAESVQSTSQGRIQFRFRAPIHLLVAYEEGERRDGESFVEGLPRSTLRHFARKLTFVPAGKEFCESHDLRAAASLTYVYLDQAELNANPEFDAANASFAPRLFFEDPMLWSTVLKLKRSLESQTQVDRFYAEALGVVLVHELMRLNCGAPRIDPPVQGGLAPWQQRTVAAYIDNHLGEQISLAMLAQLARLSPHHFCRAFKKSFGVPPHRYHNGRRIERAKALLVKRGSSVTDTGLTIGFSETSSFSAAFRRETGLTPTEYRRSFA
jgi:AraC family transcriptional regulator